MSGELGAVSDRDLKCFEPICEENGSFPSRYVKRDHSRAIGGAFQLPC
jgi:hypothetical protein